MSWEAVFGPIPAHSAVIMRTGFEGRWDDPPAYLNADAAGLAALSGVRPGGRELADRAALAARPQAGKAAGPRRTTTMSHGQDHTYVTSPSSGGSNRWCCCYGGGFRVCWVSAREAAWDEGSGVKS